MADVIEVTVKEDGSTEVIERDFTADEKAQRDADRIAAEDAAAAEAERLIAAESARRKIAEASGLTPEEMTALGF